MRKIKILLGILGMVFYLSSCQNINPSTMFKTPRGYKYATETKDRDTLKQYKISNNDILEFKLYSNDGFKLVDLVGIGSERSAYGTTNNYKVEYDGTVKLPVIGRVKLAGLTLREAEYFLEDTYAKEYIKPFVILNITNRRVILFPGSGGAATVVTLTNDNTTLIEALARAGGISQRGRAKKVKLIRGDLKNPQVFLIDLSTIDGIRQADLVLQENDIIYVEPVKDIARGVALEISPYITILSSAFLIYSTVLLLNR